MHLTKQMIQNSMLKLLHKKSVDKITVRDIVTDCGINRNTFYYHFQDIPALIEEIFRSEADKTLETYKSVDSLETCLNITVAFAKKHRKIIQNLYATSHRELYEQSLWHICEYTVTSFIETAFAEETSVTPADKSLLIHYYKCTVFGQVMDWLNHSMQTEIQPPFRRMCELHGIIAEKILRTSSGEIPNSDKS
ncbi:MAG: TetR/AcrR family transcriptional regulator C-terminal domain-containing protein [Oscillospiraceae bacterium]|nr:TetR/AcrR family transcriptional regulator C-terminal domain-containing protein [Oscillospiraceae bacterium]